MKMTPVISFALFMALAACGNGAADPGTPADNDGVKLTTVMELQPQAEFNSHVGVELSSVLQPMYNYFSILPHEVLTAQVPQSAEEQKTAIYPRIKLMSDGRYIMFYHGGRFGSRVMYVTSDDFKTWSSPVMLYEPYSIQIDDGTGNMVKDIKRFVNPDAVVLPSGEILMVCSYRASSSYDKGIGGGLSFRRSSDNGATWSKAVDLDLGPNWEPYLLLLPDGRIQCYYTDATPQTRNSGTSLIESFDGGKTWSAKKRVCRQYKYDYDTADPKKTEFNGEKIYTDQMPCFRVLNDGKTIVGWLEARLEDPVPDDCSLDKYNSHCEMSLVYNEGLDWEDLGENSEGPQRRYTNIMSVGAAGYISTFPSGEVVLSCGKNSLFHLRIGNASATSFYGNSDWTDDSNWLIPFPGEGYWGCTETVGANMMAIAMHSTEDGMQTGLLYLNHRLDAEKLNVTLDGDCSEWPAGKAFFIGSKKGDELLVRAASDDASLYLAVDRLAKKLSKNSTVTVVVAKDGSKQAINVKLNAGGLISSNNSQVSASCNTAASASGAKGFVGEVAIPLSELGVGKGDSLRFYATLEEGASKTAFSFATASKPDTWQLIRL